MPGKARYPPMSTPCSTSRLAMRSPAASSPRRPQNEAVPPSRTTATAPTVAGPPRASYLLDALSRRWIGGTWPRTAWCRGSPCRRRAHARGVPSGAPEYVSVVRSSVRLLVLNMGPLTRLSRRRPSVSTPTGWKSLGTRPANEFPSRKGRCPATGTECGCPIPGSMGSCPPREPAGAVATTNSSEKSRHTPCLLRRLRTSRPCLRGSAR